MHCWPQVYPQLEISIPLVPSALFVSLVLLVAAAKKCGARSRHITNLKQSIFSFDIYVYGLASLNLIKTTFPVVPPITVENSKECCSIREAKSWQRITDDIEK